MLTNVICVICGTIPMAAKKLFVSQHSYCTVIFFFNFFFFSCGRTLHHVGSINQINQLAPPGHSAQSRKGCSRDSLSAVRIDVRWQDNRQQQCVLWVSSRPCCFVWGLAQGKRLIRTPSYRRDSAVTLPAKEPRPGLCHMQGRNILEY